MTLLNSPMKTVSIVVFYFAFSLTCFSQKQIPCILDQDALDELCDLIRDQTPYDPGPEKFAVENFILLKAETVFNDTNRKTIVQKWWRENYGKISFQGNSAWPTGGI